MGPFPSLRTPTATLLMVNGLKLPDGRTVHPPLTMMETIEAEAFAISARQERDDMRRQRVTNEWSVLDEPDDAWRRGTPIANVYGNDEEAAQIVQDYLDGAALRKLRETLPDGWEWQVGPEYWGEPSETLHCFAGLQRDDGSHLNDYRADTPAGEGTTVAEAADKCREALP